MVLQQIFNINNENISQNPAILPETVLDPLQTESTNVNDNVPIQRPKRKIQNKNFNPNQIIDTGIHTDGI